MTSTAIAPRKNGNGEHSPEAHALMERVVIKGDLSTLSEAERIKYYGAVCASVGLNPLTQPFSYLQLGGRTVLYANRNCTDQLRTLHSVSVVEMTDSERDGVHIVTCKVANKDGRTDMAKGAVSLGHLKGEALANAIMKCETKSKRRATLSICGLSFLDETEVEDIPAESKRENPHVTRPEDVSDAKPRYDDNGQRVDWIDTSEHRVERLTKAKARPVADVLNKAMRMCQTPDELVEWADEHSEQVAMLPADWETIFQSRYQEFLDELRSKSPPAPPHDPQTGEVGDGLDIPPMLDRRRQP